MDGITVAVGEHLDFDMARIGYRALQNDGGVAERAPHRVPASRDSQSTASTIEFTTGTGPRAVLVRPDNGGVDHRVFVVRIIGQGLEKTLPNPARAQREKRLWVFFQSPKRSGK